MTGPVIRATIPYALGALVVVAIIAMVAANLLFDGTSAARVLTFVVWSFLACVAVGFAFRVATARHRSVTARPVARRDDATH
ncbi:MAG: hypothetical protein CMH36_06290 [Microbacterium sp.]|uniref:Uncharacterized protein n=1 Tax=Microbacterium ginsengisoli TaxID=400772 RepID=A0A3C1KGX6_9MICO|nr:hypothetical protein [uncultured Microbacterium sp.]MAL06421.1 hypothetical protein [Microbacterium sp.]HAN25949.1 hypothetical protein [Microbacterium ginsengisoli]